ncbi:histidine phosphatase family protein [Halalkalibacter urbisdiaboli]|uniref:histidine phosphatase family protein n=1 Tax=Halalkalibacter urbisdiaboli TaxID=1960589 RepID=UPI000B43F959|nr:histidine phosphatase family protein [Halalkalibacter urbisdiaboli]
MAMARSFTFTCIRHGLTMYNEERRYIGSTDLPLSSNGVIQMKSLAKKIADTTCIVSSDMVRCKQTTEILFPTKPYQKSRLIREYQFGDWEGKSYEELKGCKDYQNWLTSPVDYSPPNGETITAFKNRVTNGFSQIIEDAFSQNIDEVTVITHGGVIRQWLSDYAPVGKSFFEWAVPIGTVFTLTGNLAALRRGERFSSLQEEHFTGKIAGFMNR